MGAGPVLSQGMVMMGHLSYQDGAWRGWRSGRGTTAHGVKRLQGSVTFCHGPATYLDDC